MPVVEWWTSVLRPGYLGKSRDEIQAEWDKKYGKGHWKLVWQWGNLHLEREEALQVYEDAYYEFFKANPNTLDKLVSIALDVYDTNPSNIKAGFSYNHQETPNNHIHDVAIRRAVMRNGTWFKGNHLMHVRPSQEGEQFGPHLIQFHLPDMIYKGKIMYKGKQRDFKKDPPWWIKMGIPNSVEAYYQQNKILQTLSSSTMSDD